MLIQTLLLSRTHRPQPAFLPGFLVATIALAFSTLERTEVWPDRSRLVATFKAPFFVQHKASTVLDCISAKSNGDYRQN